MDWDALDAGKYRDEAETVAELLSKIPLDTAERAQGTAEALALVRGARKAANRQGVVEGFLQEFSLGTREGLALMCLAEALLRTPDERTRDRLIAEKIGSADWASHLGKSDNLFVNASTWGLMLTGKLVDVDDEARRDLPGFLKRVAGRIGEPVIRAAVAQAVRIMGEQFVLGRDIEAGLSRSRREGYVCSFDMLGKGARTAADAARYEEAYAVAIDAEEADRLVLSLKLIEALCKEPELGAWKGLGLAVQAYQKRAPQVIAGLAEVARASGRRLMVRLVKGAYWDSEIKRAL